MAGTGISHASGPSPHHVTVLRGRHLSTNSAEFTRSTNRRDSHLPAVHLRPPRNWINDPNGLVFHNGHYHVFFQYNPNGTDHLDIHWGHFRSPNLVHWEPLPIALAPTPGGDDADGCFSGNAISDGGRIVAFYSANRADRWWQPVTTAESHDGGYTWTKRPQLLIPLPPAGTTMCRDPYVWRQNHRWRMLVGASLEGGNGAAVLYESPDLENWTYHGPFHVDDSGAAAGWECPQYATFGDRALLIVSEWSVQHGPQRVLGWVGHEEDGRFTTAAPVLLDHGPDFYAPALLRAPEGRWLLWGWTPEARTADWAHEAGWAGALTLPREITLEPDGSVHQQPAHELLGLRAKRAVSRSGQVGQQPVDLGEVDQSFDLIASVTTNGISRTHLRLVTTPDGTEYLDLSIDPGAGQVVVDRTHASRDPRASGGVHLIPHPDASIPGASVDLRLVVDGSIAELYLPKGQVLTARFYPTGHPPWRLQLRGSETATTSFTVEAWNLLGD